MFLCRMVDLLYEGIPLGFWRTFLIRRHMEACPVCRAKLASREEAWSVLVQAKDVAEKARIWAGIRGRLQNETEEAAIPGGAHSLLWRWASGAAMLIAVAAAGFWLFRSGRSVDSRLERPAIESLLINDLRVGGEPARAIIYQPRDSDMVVVWAEKNRNESKSGEDPL